MILYLDASALVKRYVAEPGSGEVDKAISRSELIGTALISRVEVAAALAKATRMGALTREEAQAALQVFREEWPDLVQVQVTEILIARGDAYAWEHDLRAYRAVQLAAASLWQDAMSERVTLCTFDQRLWAAAGQAGLAPYPTDLPGLLDALKPGA